MKEFKDKVAVITGGASGIGLGIARRCVREGMRIVIADVEESALRRAEDELKSMGGTLSAMITDVSKANQVEALAKKALDTYGAVHILCNNAGVAADGSIWECSLPAWEWAVGVNIWGAINGIRTFVPIMLAQDTECHIVNTASIAGLTPYHPGASYHVTKHAVVALSENLYRSLGERGSKIKTSVLCPGFVRTRILSATRNLPAEFQAAANMQPMPREAEEGAWNYLEKNNFKVLSPDQVADLVFTAIKEDQFYILTHPEFNETVKERMENILQGKNPSLVPLSFKKAQ
ncbi:SDR family NAD(P)-dependent oxidoreductase [Pelotomaculum propionicicum]|uniref:SDR family NAD(P)-dependent oxidoreductase n=1 Tax=Pelotomaculum propionicicum TaxID=258475 RepID=UPI003B7636E6